MCGFAGSWQVPGLSAEALEGLATGMTDAILRRGPDDGGAWVDPAVGLSLGFRRLAIIDLSVEGHQPMRSASGRYVITFNGEIYNFQDLRGELEKTGATFRGHSDTEVILAAVEQWGPEVAIARLSGMFAIALWDRVEGILRLARDPLGIKPLYLGFQGGALLWGSELKALQAHPAFKPRLDRDALTLYFRHGFVPSPYSIFEGIRKLAPGCMVTLRAPSDPLEGRPFWTLKDVALAGLANPFQGDDAEAEALVDGTLRRSVARQMMADVPLGAFLSGGVDSSLIVAYLQDLNPRPVKTFCIGFSESGFDETIHARAVAEHLHTDHTEWRVSPQDALDLVPQLPDIYDEPFADPAMIPPCLVSRLARKHVTVSLSGDGGDEVFGGYGHHLSAAEGRLAATASMPRGVRAAAALGAGSLARLAALLPGGRAAFLGDALASRAATYGLKDPVAYYRDHVADYLGRGGELLREARQPAYLLEEKLPLGDRAGLLEAFQYLDSMMILPDEYLAKVDRATMSVSLEGRVPLLDTEVVELGWRLPSHLKVRGGRGKWILRRVLAKYIPSEIIDRPKHGFSVPVDAWLRGPLRPWAEELLQAQDPETRGLLDEALITRMWREHQDGVRQHGTSLWRLLMFLAWKARWD